MYLSMRTKNSYFFSRLRSFIDTKLPIKGNPNRSLWKLCAWELSRLYRSTLILLHIVIRRTEDFGESHSEHRACFTRLTSPTCCSRQLIITHECHAKRSLVQIKILHGMRCEKNITKNIININFSRETNITVQQLKKLWSNLKQSQRDALTKEKQSRLATCGGPQEVEANVDPDILNIAPHLMKTAPVLFSSNMTETEIEEKHDLTFNVMSANESADILDSLTDDDSDLKIVDSQDKHEFAFNIISTKKNVNKVDSASKENLIIDESDTKIDDLQDIPTLKTYQKQSCTIDTQRKKRKLFDKFNNFLFFLCVSIVQDCF